MFAGKRLASTALKSRNYAIKAATGGEIKIPVPWGHVAGKLWGPDDQRPIVTFHGWQDNCGSFDRLIPVLPKHLSFLTLDFPGHGLSSRIPPGMFYHNTNGPMLIRRLQKYFEWPQISLMGHSLGGITSFTYTALFPESVDLCVCIDGLNPLINAKRLERVRQSIDAWLKYDEMAQATNKKEPPVYSWQQMEQMLHEATRKSVDVDKCRYILERNVSASKVAKEKYFFHRDPRLKSGPLVNWPLEDILEATRRISCPLFASKSEQGHMASNEAVFKQVLEILQGKKECELHSVNGTHHGHLNEPEIFAEILTKFLEKHAGGDRSNANLQKMDFL